MRFDPKEVDLERVVGALTRRVMDVPERCSWRFSKAARLSRERMEAVRDRHAGERCVVIANGPSLKSTNMSLLRSIPTFCMNRAYLMFDDWGFMPTYFTCMNEVVIDQFAHDIAALQMPRFINYNRHKLFEPSDSIYFFRAPPRLRERFQRDLTKPISSGGTVTYATLQLAYFMGFQEVILVGLDHSFVEKGTPGRIERRQSSVDQSHAHPQYFPSGILWQLPDLVRSEHAYRLAKDAFERDRRRILDATVGGHCTVFPKVPLEVALAG